MAASVTVRGAARLSSTLRTAEASLTDEAIVDGTESRVLAAVRPYVPVRTGALAGSLVEAGPGQVVATADYAWPVHSGVPSRGQAPQPFAAEGLRAATPAVMLLAVERLVAVLSRVKGA